MTMKFKTLSKQFKRLMCTFIVDILMYSSFHRSICCQHHDTDYMQIPKWHCQNQNMDIFAGVVMQILFPTPYCQCHSGNVMLMSLPEI